MPRELCRALSSHRARIEAYTQAIGIETPSARRLTRAITRPERVFEDWPTLTARWREVAQAHGFVPEAVRKPPVSKHRPAPAHRPTACWG